MSEFTNVQGAINGTHLHAHVPPKDRACFRNRKGYIPQNVLAGCSLDMYFNTYAQDGRDLLTVLEFLEMRKDIISSPHLTCLTC